MPSTPPIAPRALPWLVIYVLAGGTFLMGTTEFVIAGLLPELGTDFHKTIARAGLTITVFAIGMIIGAPSIALLTLHLPRRLTLVLALVTFALGHIIATVTGSFAIVLVARLVTGVATGAFWAVSSVVVTRATDPIASSRALGLVLGGGMFANVLGVPLGSFCGQLIGWRGTFWALAVLALIAATAVARFLPADRSRPAVPSFGAELRVIANARLWLVLATCAFINAGVFAIYGYIVPIISDRAGLSVRVVPLALMAFGVGALIGNIVGGRLGDTRPYATALVAVGVTLASSAGIWAFSTQPVAVMMLFTLLGLVGQSANPILVALAIRFGGDAPTLAAALPTSVFNLGTAIGTGISSAALATALGAVAPAVVGTIFSALVLLPLTVLARLERPVHAHSPLARSDS